MKKRIRIIGLLFTVVLGVASIIATKNDTPTPPRPYIRIDDPSFEGHRINDVDETIVNGNPLLVAVGDQGSWTSSDGITWNFHPNNLNLNQLITRGQEFFAVKSPGDLYRSSNGQNWTPIGTFSVPIVYHIDRISGGDLLVVGKDLNATSQYWWPAVWITQDGANWERHFLGTEPTSEAYVGENNGNFLVVGGERYSASNPDRPKIWYSEDNGVTWNRANGPFSTETGAIRKIIKSENNVFYASSITSGYNSKLWKSIDGITWEVLVDPEVANSGENFRFNDVIATGLSNVSQVVGWRGNEPATWSYNRSNNTWRSNDPSGIFGSESPAMFTGIGYSPNITPGYVYTGYFVVNEVTIGSIWLRQPN